MAFYRPVIPDQHTLHRDRGRSKECGRLAVSKYTAEVKSIGPVTEISFNVPLSKAQP